MTASDLDKPYAVELIQFARDNFGLYQFLHTEWWNNFARKIGRGVFDRDQSITGLAKNYVPIVNKLYNFYYGAGGSVPRLSMATKRYIAEAMLKDLYEAGLKDLNKKGKVHLNEISNEDRVAMNRELRNSTLKGMKVRR